MYSLLQSICTECNRISCGCINFNLYPDPQTHPKCETIFLDRTVAVNNETQDILLTLEDETVLTNFTNSDSNAYNKDTLTESDSQNSVGSIYNISTVCNSMHDSTSSSLQAHDNFINLRLRGRGMHIGHLNIRGIRSGEKMDQIKIILHSSENDMSMLGVSESKLGEDVPDSFIETNNVKVFRKDKIQGSGGLLVYVRNDISCSRRKKFRE